MIGHIGDDMPSYEPITDFTALVEANPGLAGPNYTWDVRTVDIVGDAGVAVLVETDYFGCDFVDYFTVCRMRTPEAVRQRCEPLGRHNSCHDHTN